MPEHSSGWQFDVAEPWTAEIDVPMLPSRTADLCDIVVPRIAPLAHPRPPSPSVVVARVTVARSKPIRPATLAKALLDALHDRRKGGAMYRQFGVESPLPDDDSRFVTGLAIEVKAGSACRIEYRLGKPLIVRGKILGAVDVPRSAPNDIWADARERDSIGRARVEFAKALAEAWRTAATVPRHVFPTALVIHHRPDRDEDNTWQTWIGALLGSRWSRPHWLEGSPFGTWSPRAIASVVAGDDDRTRYELWGESDDA